MQRRKEEFFRIPIGRRCVLERGASGAEVFLDESKSFSITIPESFILKRLLEESGGVVEKNTLICEAWGNPEVIGQNSLPVAITNLRKILDLADIKIVNIPRIGYRLEVQEPDDNLELVTLPKPKAEENKKVTLSPMTLWSVLFLCGFSLYAFFYIGFSWVSIECKKFDLAEVCFIKGEPFEPKEFEGQSGYYYYSSQSGLIEVPFEI